MLFLENLFGVAFTDQVRRVCYHSLPLILIPARYQHTVSVDNPDYKSKYTLTYTHAKVEPFNCSSITYTVFLNQRQLNKVFSNVIEICSLFESSPSNSADFFPSFFRASSELPLLIRVSRDKLIP